MEPSKLPIFYETEEACVHPKEKKDIEPELKSNSSDYVTKKSEVENVGFAKNENVHVYDKLGGNHNMIDNEKNNSHQTGNNNRNCADKNLSI